nr:MAG TPA: Sensor N-terminal transmembrane domain [Caudoviricetes sp.]
MPLPQPHCMRGGCFTCAINLLAVVHPVAFLVFFPQMREN